MRGKKYALELIGGFLLYAAMLFLSIYLLQRHPTQDVLRLMYALLPVPPIGLCCWAVLRQFRRLDEMQRRLQLEALGLGFAGVAFLSLSYGFLEIAGLPKLSMFVVWPVMSGLWILGILIGVRRYK